MRYAHNEEGHEDHDVLIMLVASAIMLVVGLPFMLLT